MTPLRSSALFFILFSLILLLASAYRLPRLSERPMHGDEANQAVKAGRLYDTGVYAYDPHEHHGPTLYYATLPSLYLGGSASFIDTTETQFRLVPVFFGLAAILLLLPLRQALGSHATLWAALFFSLSHAMTYYSRYYIQEILLVCFTGAAFAAGYWWWRSGRILPALLLGVSLGLMHATKETCAVLFVTMGAAVLFTWLATLRLEQAGQAPVRCILRTSPWVVGAAIVVSVVLFSSFFTHWPGPVDSIMTYLTYSQRAEGAGSSALHDKPWHYYWELLLFYYRTAGPRWSEAGMVLLALAGAASILWQLRAAFRRHVATPALRPQLFLLFYAVFTCTAFTLIPYKTPWNVLPMLQPLILLAGVGAAAIVGATQKKWVQLLCALVPLLVAVHLGRQSYLGNFLYGADVRNPYVYAHTSTSLLTLVQRIDELAAIAPEGKHLMIQVVRKGGDYWPLPWYLRGYDRVGYWSEAPPTLDAAVIISDGAIHAELAPRITGDYQVETFGLRPNVLMPVLTQRALWDEMVRLRSQK